MQLTNFLAAALIAFSGFVTAVPTANADVATNANAADPPRGNGPPPPPPQGYGYDRNRPLDSSFCRDFGRWERECRSDVEQCDRDYKNVDRELHCSDQVKRKFREREERERHDRGGGDRDRREREERERREREERERREREDRDRREREHRGNGGRGY